MKTLTSLLLSAATYFACIGVSSTQEIDISWSEKQIYDNSKDGFMDDFIGCNSKYIYAKFDNLAATVKKENKKIKLVAFDKISMDQVADVAVIGFKENKSSANKYQGMHYYKTIVFENIVYVFWIKQSPNKDELYVQTFDSKLNDMKPLKKIYELNTNEKRNKVSNIFVLGNKKSNEQIIIGGEHPAQKGENIKVEYKVVNSDFSFAASGQVTLPVTVVGKSTDGLTSSYECGDDGNLYIRTLVSADKEEVKSAKANKDPIVYRYPILTLADVKSGKSVPFPIKAENKNIFGFDYVVEKKSVKVFGFFCDFQKDPRGNNTHGIFYGVIDNATMQMSAVNFSYFTKAQLDDLFAKDKEDRYSGQAKPKKKSKKNTGNPSKGETIASNYEIETVIPMEQDNLVLFCSRMNNYSVTTCTSNSKGGQSCTTRYYCEKSNVTVFKIGKDGSIIWASNLDRKITYNGWDVYDVNMVLDNNKFYVIYGSGYAITAEKKNRSTRKNSQYQTDRLEYAVFNNNDGKFVKQEYKVNPVNAKKADKKTVSAASISTFDNKFYTISTKTSLKVGPTILVCAGGLVCPPSILAWNMYAGFIKHGYGYLGSISPEH